MEGEDINETRAGEGRTDAREGAENTACGEERARQRWQAGGARTAKRKGSNDGVCTTRKNAADADRARTESGRRGVQRVVQQSNVAEGRGG